MDISEYIDVPIFAIVYILMEAIKRLLLKTDKQRGLIPIIAPISGAMISIVIYLVFPEFSSSVDPINAFTTGLISGAASTGGNQIYKQLNKFLNGVYDEE